MITAAFDFFQAPGYLVIPLAFTADFSRWEKWLSSYPRWHKESWQSLGQNAAPLPSKALPSPKPQRCMGFQLKAELSLVAKWGVAIVKSGVGLSSSSSGKIWEAGAWKLFPPVVSCSVFNHTHVLSSAGIIGINPHSISVIFLCVQPISNLGLFPIFHYFPWGELCVRKAGFSHPLPHKLWLGRI